MSAPGAASRLQTLTIPGPAGPLEALLQENESRRHTLGVVICHPHPLHGGTFHNKVVHRAAAALHGLGAAVLRFNSRGVGRSAGAFDHGEGELADARAALAFLRGRYPEARSWAAGFSFGSWIAARLAAAEPAVDRLILIGPPVTTQDFSVMKSVRVPTLIIQGTADTVCPLAALEQAIPAWPSRPQLIKIEGATHFFDKQLGALGEAMVQALAEPAGQSTSEST